MDVLTDGILSWGMNITNQEVRGRVQLRMSCRSLTSERIPDVSLRLALAFEGGIVIARTQRYTVTMWIMGWIIHVRS